MSRLKKVQYNSGVGICVQTWVENTPTKYTHYYNYIGLHVVDDKTLLIKYIIRVHKDDTNKCGNKNHYIKCPNVLQKC